MSFQCRSVFDGLMTLPRLWFIVLRDFPWHMVNQWALVNLRGVLKNAFFKSFLDDLSDCRLWESAGVDLLHLRLGFWSPFYECRLHSDLDEAMV